MDNDRVRSKLIELVHASMKQHFHINATAPRIKGKVLATFFEIEKFVDDLMNAGVTLYEEKITSAAAICQLHEMRERAEKMRLLYEGVERGEIFAYRWIPVSEMPPEENTQVLVYGNGCYALSEIFMKDDDGTPIWTYTGIGCDPTYWAMPIVTEKPNTEGWKNTEFGRFTAQFSEGE